MKTLSDPSCRDTERTDWDVIVVGSGFGGSIAALRLVERGARVLLLEKGRRFAPEDFAESTWQLSRWLHAPKLGCHGPFRMSPLRHVTALTGVGYGGGSLVYGNVLERPDEPFFTAAGWQGLGSWREELEPWYAQAEAMLGVTPVPRPTRADDHLAAWAATQPGLAPPRLARVGVDFEGTGSDASACTWCGACMVGCRHGAKNTLDRNYLRLAEQQGLVVRTGTTVTAVRPLRSSRYEVEVIERPRGDTRGRGHRRTFRSERVVLAAGVLGTVPLLLRMRADASALPHLSDRLGHAVRTNSEAVIAVTAPGIDVSEGPAITSIVPLGPGETLEPVRYPSGSGALRLLAAPLTSGRTLPQRLARLVAAKLRHPGRLLRAATVGDWARDTLILLYMRADDSQLRLATNRRGRLHSLPSSGPGTHPARASNPRAAALAQSIADHLGGFPSSFIMEALADAPTTAHLMGGAILSDDPRHGVIGPNHEVWGHPGLYVIDGSALPANPGINPSLTIAALAERAVASMR